ncbi:lipase member H-like [Notolabrus celidotus]|uniref:lipase member H-like n=1 Tax=Notolabrus celidotus TaxID=1203425 RepID=UPI00148FF46C|nr:lipase member H-like [Notolabrus celidotus]XP_034540082.1 lipase member H-like [Notolabrus celidotus]XP_034540083.1 lipase member H-like [Notolabrus celidotus]XP_034540084.1 lipase member H-like [Notolabrus celidotus]
MFPWHYLALLLLITVHICKAQDCDTFTDLDVSHAFLGTNLDIRLLLYTRENGSCGKLLSHTNLTAHPHFNLSRPTTFIIHGYRPTGSPPMWVENIREMVLEREDLNLIVVDWNYGAANLNYFKAVANTHLAADNLTVFIKLMETQGASLSSIHMIGVSLGAHISGFVGANLVGSIGRITALDPAGPQFTGTTPKDRLDSSDAQFVDVLHTDIDALGFREPLGHIDFYANGGTDQPGCPKTIFSGGSYFKCDHQRSVLLYLDSVTCASKAFPCSSYKDFMDGNCLSCEKFGEAGCPVFGHDVIRWKDILLRLRHTKTFFNTNAVHPFCMTNYRVDVLIWNEEERYGYITIKLHGINEEAEATIDHSAAKFQKFTETKLFAHFEKDIGSVKKVTVTFSTGNVFKPKYKLRVLRLRLTHLERVERPLCRYDILLKENKEVTFRPIVCEELSNF